MSIALMISIPVAPEIYSTFTAAVSRMGIIWATYNHFASLSLE